MTRLFFRFYLGVLAVLFLAWYIYGAVLQQRADADTARVNIAAHGGGARLVANELDSSPPGTRDDVLKDLRERFDYSVDVIALADLPNSLQRQISKGGDVFYYRIEDDTRGAVVAVLSKEQAVVRLGPFPTYRLQEIEEALGGWVRLTADKLDSTPKEYRDAAMETLRDRFDFPIDMASRDELPASPRARIVAGEDVVFYSDGDDRWFTATPLSHGTDIVRFGPFPGFEEIEQKAATTTLALVLLPAAVAIALLLRPVTRQLRYVERAAKAIAAGDLSARVDERRVNSAKSLAQSFNHMANRTETLVRTQRELLQAVSHELRTPLSRMRFAIDLIETAKDDTERKQRLDSLDAATEELDELVDELLRYVRMETAQPQLNQEHVAVHDALEALISKYAALHPSIDFCVRGEVDEVENLVFADRLGFQRVLGNLLSNAGRFAKSQVTIRTESRDGTATIDVDDDGSGIPASDRERVFEPFVRLEDSTSGNGRGVGLGLTLVKRIVTQHGGSVHVLGSPLGGCRIRTTWPSESVQEAAAI